MRYTRYIVVIFLIAAQDIVIAASYDDRRYIGRQVGQYHTLTIADYPGYPGFAAYPRHISDFQSPRLYGYPIDWCRGWGTGCGHDAALQFCQIKGFTRLVNYQMKRRLNKTLMVGNLSLCNRQSCDGFHWIRCSRY